MSKLPGWFNRNSQAPSAWYSEGRPFRHTRKFKVAAAVSGTVITAAAAYAATNWTVGLNSNATGQGQSQTVQNLTVAAVATPSAGNLLYPGGTGDVVVKITNPNAEPVTVTGFSLPANTKYAAGYSDSGLTTVNSGCTADTGSAPSLVSWSYATSTSGTAHTLTNALVVGANASLTVTLTNDASMGTSAPSACENTYFQMPALTAIAATAGAATATTSPATDAWTS